MNVIASGTSSYENLNFCATMLPNISQNDTGSYSDTVIGSAGNDVIIVGNGRDKSDVTS